jgi:hypothetical protein
MWDQYRKTFVGMQAVILIVTCGMFLAFNRLWALAALFFVTMELGALLGAVWGARLKRKVAGRAW